MADINEHINIDVNTNGGEKKLGDLTKGIKNAGDQAGKTESTFKSMFAALTLTGAITEGFKLAKDFLEASVDKAKEAELNINQLKVALDNTGKSGSFEALTTQAENLSKTFGFAKDDIIQAQGALVTYGKLSTKQMEELTPHLLDLAAKEKKSVSEVTTEVIGGLEGRGRALKGYQIELKKGASVDENYTAIVDGLSKSVAGQAKVFGDSAEGGIAKFHNSLTEIEVSVGQKILPVLGDLAKSLMPILDEIGPLVENLMPIVTTLLESLMPIVKTLGEAVIKILKPVGDIIGIVGNALKDIMPTLNPLLEAVGNLISQLLEGLVPVFRKLFDAITPIINQILPMITEEINNLSPLIDALTDVLGAVVDAIQPMIKIFFAVMKPLIKFQIFINKELIGALVAVLGPIKDFIDAIGDVYNAVADFLGLGDKKDKGIADPNFFKTIGDNFKKHVQDVVIEGTAEIAKAQKDTDDKKAEEDEKTAAEVKKEEEKKLKDFQNKQKARLVNFKKGSDEEKNTVISNLKEEAKYYADHYKALGLSEDEYKIKVGEINQQIADDTKAQLDEETKKSQDATKAKLEDNLVLAKNDQDRIKAQKDLLDESAGEQIAAAGDNADEIKLIQDKLVADKQKLDDDYLKSQKDKDNKYLMAQDDVAVKSIEAKNKELEKKGELTKDDIEKEKEIKLKQSQDQEAIDLQNAGDDVAAKLAIEQEYADKKQAIIDAAAENEKAKDDEVAKKKMDNLQAGLQAASNSISAISSLADELADNNISNLKKGSESEKRAAKKKFDINKGLGLINAGINVAEGITKALTDPFPLNLIESISVGIAGAAQIATIAAKKFNPDSPDSNKGSTPKASIPSASSLSSFNPSTFIGLGQRQQGAPQKLNAQRVYVVETDITKTQNKVSVIESRAKVG